MGKKSGNPIWVLWRWMRRQPPKVKAFLAVIAGIAALIFLRSVVNNHDNLFIASEAVHALGIAVLIYKLTRQKTCAGLSLKSQELTAIFLGVRLYCSVVIEFDIHTLLDSATLASTLWVIYMIRYKLKSTYMKDLDNFPTYYVVLDSHGHLLTAFGHGLWPCMVLLSEIVQTFILSDFCYYYMKSVVSGQLVMQLPSGVV